jgi:hypothetical protein
MQGVEILTPQHEDPARENNPENVDLAVAAKKWMDAHPEIYELFKTFAQELVRLKRPFGIGLLTERVRWECATLYGEDYKINNNYRAYIARALIRDVPELEKYIRFRQVRYPRGGRHIPHKRLAD